MIKKRKIFLRILILIINLLMIIFVKYTYIIIPIILSLYFFIDTLASIMDFVLLKVNKIKRGFNNLISGIIYFIIGISIILLMIFNINIFIKLLGIYFILVGLNYIIDYIGFFIKIKRTQFKILFPFLIELLFPIHFLNSLEKKYQKNKNIYKILNTKDKEKYNFEILIHITEDGPGKFGHLDLCYKNQVISYGNYDVVASRLNGIFGKGALFMINNKKDYINHCIDDSKKTIISFGIKLTKEEEKQLEKNIKELKEELISWEPLYSLSLNKKTNIKLEDCNDYASRMYKNIKPDFYKFKEGRFTMFYILKNNCVNVFYYIIRKIKLYKFYGVITPGVYYEYLQRDYFKKDSNVISRKIYNKYNYL
jgi:hypothetical protein